MKTKKLIKVVANVLIWIVFGLSLLTVILALNTTQGIPNIFGMGYLTVQSDSMAPTFDEGDLLFVHTTSATDVFEEQDIVTFRTIIGGEQILNTHRIISFQTIDGIRYYTTQGDNVGQSDLATITSGDIVAKYTGFRLIGLGNVMDYTQSKTGFFLIVVLPLAALFIYQIISFSMIIAKYKNENKVAPALDINTMSEDQKAEIAKQYLESLKSKKDEDNSKK